MGQRRINVDMPQLEFRASFDPSSIDVEKRTARITWTTGARVLRGGFFTEPYYEELSLDPKHVRMGRLKSGAAPLLNSHRSDDIADILGVIEDAQLNGSEGEATVRFDSGPAGEDAFRRVRERTLRNASVGYRNHRLQEVVDKSSKIPVYRAVDWEPYEISLLPIGADAGAVTRSGGGTKNPCEFIQERTMPPETTETANPTTTAAQPAAAPAPAPVAMTNEQRAEIESAATERVLGIQRIGAICKRSLADIEAAIKSGMSLDAWRAASIDALAEAPADKGGVINVDKRDPRIEAGADQRDKFLQRSENWIVQRCGLSEMFRAYAEKKGQKLDLDPGESRGLSMLDMARECLERAGVNTRGMDRQKMVGLAFTHRSGANSTSDYAVLLENVLHKTLLSAYGTTPDTWRRFCVTGNLVDFRAHNRYRQGSFGVFDALPEGGEYKMASIPDGEKQTITAATKGRMIAITRQAIVNDDMGSFTDLATRLGRAAALTIEVDVYALLTSNPLMSDGLTLFHANHKNIGTAAAISVASVEADRVLMAQQQDPNKQEYLELRPAILLVPIGLGGYAKVINSAQYDVDKVANARNQEPNKVLGLYRDVVDTARLTGTTRYSFADPAVAPVIEVGFLDGQQEPYLEMRQGWEVDGVQWKARLDYGVAARDWRGVVQNAGA